MSNSGKATYKIRTNSNRVVKVDIYPSNKDVIVRTIGSGTHRSRYLSELEPHLYSSRRPSVLTLLVITMVLILVELQIILHSKSTAVRSEKHTASLRIIGGAQSESASAGSPASASNSATAASFSPAAASVKELSSKLECQFLWDDMQCSEGCCLHTYERKGSPVSLCESCGASDIIGSRAGRAAPLSTSMDSVRLFSALSYITGGEKRASAPIPLSVEQWPGYAATPKRLSMDGKKKNKSHGDEMEQTKPSPSRQNATAATAATTNVKEEDIESKKSESGLEAGVEPSYLQRKQRKNARHEQQVKQVESSVQLEKKQHHDHELRRKREKRESPSDRTGILENAIAFSATSSSAVASSSATLSASAGSSSSAEFAGAAAAAPPPSPHPLVKSMPGSPKRSSSRRARTSNTTTAPPTDLPDNVL